MTAAATTEARVEVTWSLAEEDTVTDTETTWLRDGRIVTRTAWGLERASVEEGGVLLSRGAREVSVKLSHGDRERGRRVVGSATASSWSVVESFADEGEPFLSRSVVFGSEDVASVERNNLLEAEDVYVCGS